MKQLKNRPWQVLSSKYLAREPWYTVRHESICSPEGRLIPDYYIFEYPEWINILAITREGKFVLIDQYRHGLGETSYELPAGCVDSTDASILDAAQRELTEETGYGGGTWQHTMTISANPATQSNLTHCFIATGVELLDTQNLDDTEEINVHLFTREELFELLHNNAIRQALMVAPLWRYFYENRE